MAEGLLLYEDSLNRYGIPDHIASDPDRASWVEVEDELRTDHVEVLMDQWQKANSDLQPGQYPRLIDRARNPR